MPAGLATLIGLVLQIMAGAIAFIAVFLTALGIAVIVHYFETIGVAPKWLVVWATRIEAFIFVVDCVVFSMFLMSEVIKFGRALLEDLKR